ncbi:MAG TPA: YezD family protein [Nitrosospira sp.]|nr:YezD family protein [Nitrosospira sp.]
MMGNTTITDLEERNSSSTHPGTRIGKRIPPHIKEQILSTIANIEYGSVEVVVHDGKVVQIECREKLRVGR